MKSIKLLFSAEKCLDNLLLNIFGFQVIRYLLARFFYTIKHNFIKSNEYQEVKKKGYSQIENFLNEEDFKKIIDEYSVAINDQRYAKKVSQQIDGTIDEGLDYISMPLNDNIKNVYPNLYNLKNNQKVKNYFYECEQKNNIQIHARLEKIIVRDKTKLDPNKDYHFDTFHHTFKAWLFLGNVRNEDGPFHIVPNTHKLSFGRLFFEWKMSILYSLKKINSSFRSVKRKEILDNKSKSFKVSKNTFLMANVHALHRRGDAENNTERVSIQFWTRENPFKIFL